MDQHGKYWFFSMLILVFILIKCGGDGGGPSSEVSDPPQHGIIPVSAPDAANDEVEINLTWDSDDQSVAGFKIYYGSLSRDVGQYEHSIDVGMATQMTRNKFAYRLKGLTKDQIYFLAVTAYNTSKIESIFSDEVSGPGK